jgi:hypothetical protein
MTTRQRAIHSVTASASVAIRWEAAANGEQVHEQDAATIRRHVEDACSVRQTAAWTWNAPRFVHECIRSIETSEGVKRGWWS